LLAISHDCLQLRAHTGFTAAANSKCLFSLLLYPRSGHELQMIYSLTVSSCAKIIDEKQDVVFEHLMNVIFYAALVLSFVLVVCLIGISLAGIAHLWDKYANKNKRAQPSNE
jgi:hypothetical protein